MRAALAALVAGSTLALATGPAGAAFPGENGKIAFSTFQSVGANSQIYTIEPDGTGETNVSGAGFDSSPAWSPDGTRIAFDSFRDFDFEIYVMDADGSNQTRLTTSPGTDAEAAWSPDGTQIAFRSERDGNSEIYVMDADGSNQTRITDDPARDARPSWSPDGTQIAFQSDRDGDFEIYVMAPDGSGVTALTDDPGTDANPAWSPDGTQLVFNSDRDGDHDIYVMAADGSGVTPLTDDPAADSNPAWSPDGTQIAFTSNRDANNEIYVMDADGSNQTRLTDDPGSDSNADWQPLPVATGPGVDVEPVVAGDGSRGQVRGTITCAAGSLFLIELELTQGPAAARGRARGTCTGSPQAFAVGFATSGDGFEAGPAEACITARTGDPGSRTVTGSASTCETVEVSTAR